MDIDVRGEFVEKAEYSLIKDKNAKAHQGIDCNTQLLSGEKGRTICCADGG